MLQLATGRCEAHMTYFSKPCWSPPRDSWSGQAFDQASVRRHFRGRRQSLGGSMGGPRADAPGARDGLAAAGGFEFPEDAVDVGLDRAHADHKCHGNLLVGCSGGDQTQHLLLALAEWV